MPAYLLEVIMSQLNIQQRRSAAQVFCEVEAGQISQTRRLVLDSAHKLLRKYGHMILNRQELKQAYDLLEQNQLDVLFHKLRDKASSFVHASISAVYWSWIDAVGFLSDATGIRWPYMTEGGRKSSLRHAQQCAQEVLSALS